MTVVGTMENTLSPTMVTCQKDLKIKNLTKKKCKKSDEDHSVETELINKTRKSRRGRPSQCTEFWLMYKEIYKKNETDPSPLESTSPSTTMNDSTSSHVPVCSSTSKCQSSTQSSPPHRTPSTTSPPSSHPPPSNTTASRHSKCRRSPSKASLAQPPAIQSSPFQPFSPYPLPPYMRFTTYPPAIFPPSSYIPSTLALQIQTPSIPSSIWSLPPHMPLAPSSTMFHPSNRTMPNHLSAAHLSTVNQSLTYPLPIQPQPNNLALILPSLNNPSPILQSLPIQHLFSSTPQTIPPSILTSVSNGSSQCPPLLPSPQPNVPLSRSNSSPISIGRNAMTPPKKRMFSESKDEGDPSQSPCKRPNSESSAALESNTSHKDDSVKNEILELAKEVSYKEETLNRKQAFSSTLSRSISFAGSQQPTSSSEVQNLQVPSANPLDLSVAGSNPGSHEKDYRESQDLLTSKSYQTSIQVTSNDIAFNSEKNEPCNYSVNISPTHQLQNTSTTSEYLPTPPPFSHSKFFGSTTDSPNVEINKDRTVSLVNQWNKNSKKESHPSTVENIQDLQTKTTFTTGNPSFSDSKTQMGLAKGEHVPKPLQCSKTVIDDNQCLNLSNRNPVAMSITNGLTDSSEVSNLSNPQKKYVEKFENGIFLDSPEDLRVHALDLSTSKVPLDLRRH